MAVITIKNQTYQAPYSDLIRHLTDDEYDRLKGDIVNRGIKYPVLTDEARNILDGYHRAKIASELNIECPIDILAGLSDEEKEKLALDLNWNRRHLTRDEIKAIAERRKAMGWSNGRIAEELGVDTETIRRSTSAITGVERTNGKDSKSRPAQMPTEQDITQRRLKVRELKAQGKSTRQIATELGVSVGTVASDLKATKQHTHITNVTPSEAQKTFESLQNVDTTQLPKTKMTGKRSQRIVREKESEQPKEIEVPDFPPEIDIRLGDFQSVLSDIEPDSIDLVFTDPPYHEKHLDLWRGLAELSAKVLKSGKLLVTYSGQYHLLTIMNILAEHLNYVWLGTVRLPGHHNQVQQRKIRNQVKPLLFFSKGDYQAVSWLDDYIENDQKEKELHDWQQGIAPALYYIEQLTNPSDRVLDPFLGGGTTAEATIKLNRSIIGSEINQSHYQTTLTRLEKANGS